jgi:hypothetical protein
MSIPEAWCWGTSHYYARRVHVVHPKRRETTLCGLPVDEFSDVRPSSPERLCPECCVQAMAIAYPPRPGGAIPEAAVRPSISLGDDPSAVTVEILAVRDGDP